MENFAVNIINAERAVLFLLLVALLVSVAAKRFRLPYTVGLVIIGLGMTAFPDLRYEISPELILGLFVPPLLFEASFHLRLHDLRRDLGLISLLAIPGVVVTTLLVGWAISLGTGMEITIALVFGALIAATDPVAVVALFKQLGVPKRLQVLLEGESLFNDGTAIVMFGLMMDIAVRGEFVLTESLIDFVRIAGGGAFVGLVLGLLGSLAIRRVNDPLVETTITTILAFSAYLLGEDMHVSGVLAVVITGIVAGNASPTGMSPTTRIVVNNFWEYGAFLANSLIFLLIGLSTDLQELMGNWDAIIVAILATLGARAVSIYGLPRLFGFNTPKKWRHVLYWGGLRGAIVLALALSLPTNFPERERLLAMSFGVVLFTLLVQGFTMDRFIKYLDLVKRADSQVEYERRHARLVSNRSAFEQLESMGKQGFISALIWERLRFIFQKREKFLIKHMQDLLNENPAVEIQELNTARNEALLVERNTLGKLFRDGVISEDIYEELVGEVDEALTAEHVNWSQILRFGGEARAEIKVSKMMAVVIQEDDLPEASRALGNAGFGVDQFSSTGGFFSRSNITLIIGIPDGREKDVVEILRKTCKTRTRYIKEPLGKQIFPFVRPVPVKVGGATIFTFDVEAYHEF